MKIKTKKEFKEILKSLTAEVIDEITVTGNVDGYNTPFAFAGKGKKSKKRRKKISTNSTGYDMVSEDLSNSDIKSIRKLIRDVVANILRDIWLKRSTWKQPK